MPRRSLSHTRRWRDHFFYCLILWMSLLAMTFHVVGMNMAISSMGLLSIHAWNYFTNRQRNRHHFLTYAIKAALSSINTTMSPHQTFLEGTKSQIDCSYPTPTPPTHPYVDVLVSLVLSQAPELINSYRWVPHPILDISINGNRDGGGDQKN